MSFKAVLEKLISRSWVAVLAIALNACGGEPQVSEPISAPATGSSSSSSGSSVTNQAPVITGTAVTTATVGSSYSFTPGATDADGDALTYSASGVPAWATFNTTTYTLSGTPASAGSYGPITISVTDGKASASLSPFTIVVSPAIAGNTPPVISGSPATNVDAGNAYAFTPTATDANGDTLTYSISNKPVWAAFNTSTGTLTGTPNTTQSGTYAGIVITVSDGRGGSASLAPFSIVVAPVYTIGGTVSGLATGRQLILRNNGGNPLTVTTNGPFNFSVTQTTGTSYFVTVGTQPASQTCSISNGSGNVTSANITSVSVTCVTNTYTVGGTVSGLGSGKTLVLNNNGGNALTVSANGSFTFSIALASGTYAVTVSTPPTDQTCLVANGSGTIASANVTNISVTCTTNTYTVGGTVSGLGSGKTLVLNNMGGNPKTVSSNGTFTFSTALTAGSSYSVTVATPPTGQTCLVTSGSGTIASANVTAVNVNCTTTNNPPTITGTPATTITAGTAYSFIPSGADSNGDPLAYLITNKPAWATFNTVTGALTGTPGTAGTYANIVISVSDGTASTSLPAFTITVNSSTASTVLTWTKPTQNTDGSTLTDLTGYKIYYGTNSSSLTSSVTVSDPNATTTTISGLTTGTTYYFAIASISASGGEGNKSNAASKLL